MGTNRANFFGELVLAKKLVRFVVWVAELTAYQVWSVQKAAL